MMTEGKTMQMNPRLMLYRKIERSLKNGLGVRVTAQKHKVSLETITTVLFWLLDGRPDFREFNYSGRMGHWQDRQANVARVYDLHRQYRSTLKAA